MKNDSFILVSLQKLKKKYTLRLFAVLIPFIQFDIVLALMIFIDKVLYDNVYSQLLMYRLLVIDTSVLLVIFVYGCLLKSHLIKCHKKNTFIELLGEYIVISIHHQTVLGLHMKYYKKLYLMKLSDLTSVSIKKHRIIIKGTIKGYYDKAERLRYNYVDNTFKFDEWWYDYNCSENLSQIVITDVFESPARLLHSIRNVSAIEKARAEKHRQYHEKMMALAKSPRKKTRVLRTELYENKKR